MAKTGMKKKKGAAKKTPAAPVPSLAIVAGGPASRSFGIVASRPAPLASGSRMAEATLIESRQATTAPQLPPGAKTITAKDLVLASHSPTIVAESKVSMCSEDDVKHIREQFYFPKDITTWAMLAEERPNRPLRSLVAFNKAIMKHGARLPLHTLVQGVLAHWGLSPSQLNPNAYKIMAGMHVL